MLKENKYLHKKTKNRYDWQQYTKAVYVH